MEFTGGQAPANQGPTVNAGTAQTITLPTSSVTLGGSASDVDGWISSLAWSQVSGPSQALISSPSSASTLVSSLVQGTYSFKLTATDNSNATASATVSVTVNASTSTTPSTSLKIEAENFTQMSGVQTENTQDVGGGLNVGWQDNGDWMDYAVNIATAGTYTVNFRVASFFAGAQFQLKKADGTLLATVTVPNTGSFQSWQTVAAQVPLAAGQQNIRIVTANANGGWNINWWEVTGASSGTTTPPPTSPDPTPSTSPSLKIEAESFTQMSGVQTENTQDVGGGLNVGWQDNNDWMDYSVNISTAGTYTVNFRVASFFAGAQFQLRNASGAVLTTVTVPNTGSFQTWQTVSAQVALPAGQQTLRIITSNANGGWNINWCEIAGASSTGGTTTPPPTSSTSLKIEAESFTQMSGVQTENTQDVGGGLNVGWQDNNDWMDYSVNLATSGSYTVNFRVASFFSGAQFQLRNASGAVLTTVTVPNTGSFQSWQTVSAQVSLPAGQQTLRLFTSNANGGWNINWWEILSGTTSARGGSASVEEVVAATPSNATGLQLYPNPVKDRVMLKVSNELTGRMMVEVRDLKGAAVKQFSLNKANKGTMQTYLSLGELPTGQYIITISMKDYQLSKQLIKQ
jgi:5-hydroxyisourate hydrolase-like protein (transthyretin family)